MINQSNILFDLDGTLTDPKQGITKSVQYALGKFNIIVDNLDRLEPFIGPPLTESFVEHYSFTEADAVQGVVFYREYFKEQGIFDNKIYPGMIDLLELLKSQNRTLRVATSKPTVFAERILEHFNIAKYFDFVCGSNLDGSRVAKTEIIHYLMEQEKLDKSTTIMIGDRKHDIIGAHNNGIASIGIGYGYGSEEEMKEIKPTYYVRTVKELMMAFMQK